jgi:hypothetical protein
LEISTRGEPARPEPLKGRIAPFRPPFHPENAELAKNWPKNERNVRYLDNGWADLRNFNARRTSTPGTPQRAADPPFSTAISPQKTQNWPKIGRKMTKMADIFKTASLTPIKKAGNGTGQPRDV